MNEYPLRSRHGTTPTAIRRGTDNLRAVLSKPNVGDCSAYGSQPSSRGVNAQWRSWLGGTCPGTSKGRRTTCLDGKRRTVHGSGILIDLIPHMYAEQTIDQAYAIQGQVCVSFTCNYPVPCHSLFYYSFLHPTPKCITVALHQYGDPFSCHFRVPFFFVLLWPYKKQIEHA